MLNSTKSIPLATLPVRDQVKELINRIITRVQETPLSLKEIETLFLEWTPSEVDAEFYFEACDTCFPELSLYGYSALRLEEALPLLDDVQAFERLTIELGFLQNTYMLNFAFDWADPTQFKTVATNALRELANQSSTDSIEETLRSLSKTLSWDERFSKELYLKNLRLV